jgi:hypothetical protein
MSARTGSRLSIPLQAGVPQVTPPPGTGQKRPLDVLVGYEQSTPALHQAIAAFTSESRNVRRRMESQSSLQPDNSVTAASLLFGPTVPVWPDELHASAGMEPQRDPPQQNVLTPASLLFGPTAPVWPDELPASAGMEPQRAPPQQNALTPASLLFGPTGMPACAAPVNHPTYSTTSTSKRPIIGKIEQGISENATIVKLEVEAFLNLDINTELDAKDYIQGLKILSTYLKERRPQVQNLEPFDVFWRGAAQLLKLRQNAVKADMSQRTIILKDVAHTHLFNDVTPHWLIKQSKEVIWSKLHISASDKSAFRVFKELGIRTNLKKACNELQKNPSDPSWEKLLSDLKTVPHQPALAASEPRLNENFALGDRKVLRTSRIGRIIQAMHSKNLAKPEAISFCHRRLQGDKELADFIQLLAPLTLYFSPERSASKNDDQLDVFVAALTRIRTDILSRETNGSHFDTLNRDLYSHLLQAQAPAEFIEFVAENKDEKGMTAARAGLRGKFKTILKQARQDLENPECKRSTYEQWLSDCTAGDPKRAADDQRGQATMTTVTTTTVTTVAAVTTTVATIPASVTQTAIATAATTESANEVIALDSPEERPPLLDTQIAALDWPGIDLEFGDDAWFTDWQSM